MNIYLSKYNSHSSLNNRFVAGSHLQLRQNYVTANARARSPDPHHINFSKRHYNFVLPLPDTPIRNVSAYLLVYTGIRRTGKRYVALCITDEIVFLKYRSVSV